MFGPSKILEKGPNMQTQHTVLIHALQPFRRLLPGGVDIVGGYAVDGRKRIVGVVTDFEDVYHLRYQLLPHRKKWIVDQAWIYVVTYILFDDPLFDAPILCLDY